MVVWLVATLVAAAACLLGFRIDNSVGIWFPKDDPALTQYRAYLTDFGKREWMLVALDRLAVEPERARVDLDTVTSRLARLEHVHRVVSSADLPPEARLTRRLFRPDAEDPTEAVLLLITNDIDTQDGYRETLVNGIRRAADGVTSVAQIHVAGTAVINGELNKAARRDMILFFPAVGVLVTLLGLFLFRNARDTALLLCVSFGTVVATQGLLIGLGNSLNMITIMLPTVLIALSVADAVHLIHAYHAARASESDAFAASWAAVKSIAWPCLGTTLTTIAGFLAFSRSSVVPVHQLALFASFGIAFAWVLTMTGAPILLATFWQDRVRAQPPAAVASMQYLRRSWRFVDRHPRWFWAASALATLSLFGLGSLVADTDYVRFFRATSRVPSDYRALQAAGLPQNGLHLIFEAPTDESVRRPEYGGPLALFAERLESMPGVHSVLSPFQFSDLSAVPGAEADSWGFFAGEAKQVQLVAMTDYPSSRQLNALIDRIQRVADEDLPSELHMKPTGTSLLWAHMDDGVIRTQKESLVIVCLVCFGILLVLFRSLGLATVGLALSLLPVGSVLGLMGLWGIPVNMATVLIAGIAVGLAVDDTIHFVHAFQGFRHGGANPRSACEQAVLEVGLRMVMTSLVLVGAFATMGFSDFMPTAQFGLLSSLTILLAFVADLTLLPLVLSWKGRAQAGDPAPQEGSGGLRERSK